MNGAGTGPGVGSGDAETPAETHPHRIEVTIEQKLLSFASDITFRGVCDAPEGAPCRLWCSDPGCQEEAGPDHDRHILVDQGMCGVITTLNADQSMITELYTGPSTSLRSDFIDLEQDYDGVTWRYHGDCAAECRHQCPACRAGLVSHLECDPRCILAPQDRGQLTQ